MTVEVSRMGQQIRIQTEVAVREGSMLLRGVEAVQSVTGGAAKTDPLGTRVIPVQGSNALTVQL